MKMSDRAMPNNPHSSHIARPPNRGVNGIGDPRLVSNISQSHFRKSHPEIEVERVRLLVPSCYHRVVLMACCDEMAMMSGATQVDHLRRSSWLGFGLVPRIALGTRNCLGLCSVKCPRTLAGRLRLASDRINRLKESP